MADGKIDLLVTGAAGFAGRHLLRAVCARGDSAVGTYYRTRPPVESSFDNIQWFKADVGSTEHMTALIENLRPRSIVNLAAASVPAHANSAPRSAADTNVTGWINILEAVQAADWPCRVLLISTYHVYGSAEPGLHGFDETQPVQPGDVYAATRVLGETIARSFVERCDLDVIVGRVANHTGPGQSPQYFVSSLCRQVARIESGLRAPFVEVGNIDVARDISDVRDVVDAYLCLLDHGRAGEIYNVCSGTPTMLSSIVGWLQEASTEPFTVRVAPDRLRGNEASRLFANRAKLTRDTRWQPKFDIHQTVRDVLDWWREGVADDGSERDRVPRIEQPLVAAKIVG